MQQYLEVNGKDDPLRDEKVHHNRQLRATRIRLSGEHFEGQHHDTYQAECVECNLASLTEGH